MPFQQSRYFAVAVISALLTLPISAQTNAEIDGKKADEEPKDEHKTHQNDPPAAMIWQARSDNGHFSAALRSENGKLVIGGYQRLHLTITDRSGQPVENAAIEVDGGMLAHGHGLPTKPEVGEYSGDGKYVVEGIQFNMTGAWVLAFRVTTGANQDIVKFDLKVGP